MRHDASTVRVSAGRISDSTRLGGPTGGCVSREAPPRHGSPACPSSRRSQCELSARISSSHVGTHVPIILFQIQFASGPMSVFFHIDILQHLASLAIQRNFKRWLLDSFGNSPGFIFEKIMD